MSSMGIVVQVRSILFFLRSVLRKGFAICFRGWCSVLRRTRSVTEGGKQGWFGWCHVLAVASMQLSQGAMCPPCLGGVVVTIIRDEEVRSCVLR